LHPWQQLLRYTHRRPEQIARKAAWCLARIALTVSMTSATYPKLSYFIDHGLKLAA
jgi:hypothetical protein